MDHETLIRNFRAERADRDPRARAAAWGELELKLDGAPPVMPSAPRRSHRRSLFAITSAGALAAIVAAVLVLSSGPSAEPAAAEVLHQTASVAASDEAIPALQAEPGQYYFTKKKELEFKGWYPGSYEVPEGRATRPGGFSALVPSESEWWISPEGGSRTRQTIGTPRFLSSAEQSRWQDAGSPLPSAFEPARQEELQRLASGSDERFLEMRRGVLDVEHPTSNGATNPELVYPDLSNAPTDPAKLRLAIQNHQVPGVSDEPGKPLSTKLVIEALGGLLSRPNASPALRAAAFNALAEVPGVELKRDATDLVGRSGYAIGYSSGRGFRVELIFDPKTSMSLGERVVLADPEQDPEEWKGYEAGLTLRDVAYMQSDVVDSTHEPAGEEQNGH
jgi:hypothetical protein